MDVTDVLAKVPVILTAFLMALGKFLKMSSLKNEWIPGIVMLAGTVLNPLIQNAWADPYAWMVGFMAGGAAVGSHQLTRQTTQGVKEEVREHKAEKAEAAAQLEQSESKPL